MTIIVKSNHFTVVVVDSGSGNDRPSEIAANMNILVAGAKGMVGIALCVNLRNIKENKKRTAT